MPRFCRSLRSPRTLLTIRCRNPGRSVRPTGSWARGTSSSSGLPRQDRSAGSWGMATAEYAIATLAACGFAGLLLTVLRSGEVREMLEAIVHRALSVG
ncbi:MAG: hypothetical protein QG608_2925 [Actinomycetota bacterium]|nr:hypothetical protein [Actinomycetota bacterium]